MSFVLLLLGVATAAAGFAMIGFGIPINEFSLGNTLIISGMSAVAGGFVVIALSFAVRQLTRIANALSAGAAPLAARPSREPLDPTQPGGVRQGGPRPPYPSGGPQRTDGPPREPRAPEPRLSAPPAEAGDDHGYRSPPQGYAPPHAGEPAMVAETEEVPLSPRPPARSAEPASERKGGWLAPGKRDAPPEAPRVPPAGPRAPEPSFDKVWPADLRVPPQSEHDTVPPARINGDASRHVTPSEPVRQPPPDEPVTVLKSGVVDGMAYTLYTDGSIEAELAQGVVRFGSIEELRNHLEKSA